jgi:hypothetical protein
MATPDEIREKLRKQAEQRVNPLMRGLSLLTGGLAGEFTGTNESIRNRELARRSLMAEEAAALEDQRILERARITREEELKRRIAEKAAEDEARLLEETRKARGVEMALKGEDMVGPLDPATMAGMAAAKAAQAKIQADRMNAFKGRETEMRGYLAGRNVQLGDPDVETVAFLEAQEKAKQEVQREARQAKLDEGKVFVSRNAAGEVTVQGPLDLVRKYQEANPDIFSSVKGSPYKISMRQTEDGSSFNVDFGDMTVGQVEELAPQIDKMRKAYGSFSRDDLSGAGAGGEGTKTFPKGPSREKGEPMVGRNDGKVRSPGPESTSKPKSEAAASIMAEMYGPLSPSEQFTKTGRELKALEGRGGTYTYGASETLTDPFYESVASELGTKPQRIGQESVLVKGAKSVIANEFPTEQWNSLPQEVKNRIYIEALNKSAAEMSKPQTSRGYNRSPFADISYQRD